MSWQVVEIVSTLWCKGLNTSLAKESYLSQPRCGKNICVIAPLLLLLKSGLGDLQDQLRDHGGGCGEGCQR